MARDAMESVLAAEAAARDLLAEARDRAADRLDGVKTEAAELKQQILEDAEAQAARLDTEAREAGEQDGAPRLRAAEAEAARYEALSEAQLSVAADEIVQKVMAYGNR